MDTISAVRGEIERTLGQPVSYCGKWRAPREAGDISAVIDHTLLKPEATPQDITRLCREARRFGFASVCVNPVHVHQAAAELQGSGVSVCTVVGFPLGATTTAVKVAETRQALEQGANEVDMVLAIGLLKAKQWQAVYKDIKAVVNEADQALVKVIIETCLLEQDEKIAACLLCAAAGADFVKTSTGFSTGGATEEDIQLMRRVVGDKMGIKASGGIRTKESAVRMLKAGANRIGSSASVSIVADK